MGMYTELVLAFNLKPETPSEVVNILRFMMDTSESNIQNYKLKLPDHPLFTSRDSRWRFMLQCSSYYHVCITNSCIFYDKILGSHKVAIRSSFKNYDDEINRFIDWIKPYVEPNGFAGYSIYEEAEEPTLIYFK